MISDVYSETIFLVESLCIAKLDFHSGDSMKSISIPRGVQEIINRLHRCDYNAYVVGGCVRDSLLGLEPKDWDICTSATPDIVLNLFQDKRIIETGLKHGTVTIVMNDGQYEVTTFRVDGDYTDGRHPDSVRFVQDVRYDLSRRDFTINAMAYNDKEGLIDPFGGAKDLEYSIIRCVGNATERFSEDALRILRAMRFASVYKFYIEEDTSDAIHVNRDLLKLISAERIQAELVKMLKGAGVLANLLEFSDVIAIIIPEMQPCIGFDQHNKYHQYTIYEHIAHAVSNYADIDSHNTDLFNTFEDVVSVALLLHDIGKPECYTEDENGGHFYGHGEPSARIAAEVVKRLKFDNQSQHDIVELVQYHDVAIEPTLKTVRRWLNKLGETQFMRLMDIRLADIWAHSEGTQESRIEKRNRCVEIAKEIIQQNQCFQMKDLAISGKDLINIGFKEGRELGYTLRCVLDAVIDGEVVNEKESLLKYVESLRNM